ncbi:MAG: hypothetical protein P4L84_06975 [Isosphaeraceae bacterium]|nr:hypothetical protein [Isosphaeraceae bacterium]
MIQSQAPEVLRNALARLRSQSWERERWDPSRIQANREEAMRLYGMILSPDGAGAIDKATFVAFLHSENRWHRMGLGSIGLMTADMPRLRAALTVLVDERQPLSERLERVRPRGQAVMVHGLGPGIITVILHFVDPNRYGILSGSSERVLQRLGLYPELPVAASLAVRFEAVNPILLGLASSLGIGLGLLDSLWWRVPPPTAPWVTLPPAVAR